VTGFHMDPEEFRRRGREVVDWVADYMARVDGLPITPEVQPGDILARLPEHPPEEPEPFDALLGDLDEVVLPGITHWQSPGWFAYFPANVSGPSVLAELAAAGLGVQGMLWATSPAATEVELRVVDWLVELLGLPPHFTHREGPGGGTIQMSASDATHLVHVVARSRGYVAYCSDQAHSSVARGARVAGLTVRRIATAGPDHALDPRALAAAVAEDAAAGRRPAIVTSAIGTTGTGAVDPVDAVADVAQEHGMWHHVDAAWAGSAMVLPEQRVHQRGVERVDSYTFNPHKWLFTNFDCNVLWWADRAPVIDALSDTPPYLRDAAGEMDLRDWQLPLGRRFRALKLWWVLRHYGGAGLRHHVGEHIRLAQELAARVDAHPLLEHVAPPSFALVSFRHAGGDEATDALAAAVNATGHSYLTASALGDTRFIRIAVGQAHTTADHVERLWSAISQSIGSPDGT
jgi:aromatic-L-amino-acid/L-tryptophan decarboxylase